MRMNSSTNQSKYSKMLRYFPELLPDELLYSGLCRYCQEVHQGVRTRTTSSLFGIESITFSPYFPPFTDEMCKRIGSPRWNPQSLLLDHTPLSVYYAFMPSDRRSQLFTTSPGKSIIRMLGTSICKLHSQRPLLFCPQCIKNDSRQYGFPYWHCTHNLPGVRICREHGTPLINACPICGEPIGDTNRNFLHPLKLLCSNGHPIFNTKLDKNPIKHHETMKLYSQEIAELAMKSRTIVDMGYPDYIAKSRDNGYLTVDMRIRRSKLCEDFANTFPNDLIQSYGLSMSQSSDYGWLNDIVRRPYVRTNPVMHMLLILFLFGSIEAFIEYQRAATSASNATVWESRETQYFRCLNPLCPQYRHPVIPGYDLIKSRKTAKYCCPQCGYTYYRCIEHAESDDAPILRSRKLGHLWQQTLADAYKQYDGNIVHIRQALHLSSNKQVIIHLQQIGLLPGSTSSLNIRKVPKAELRRKYIELIKSAISSHPEWTRSSIQKDKNTAYRWLAEHEKDTLYALLPPRVRPKRTRNVEERRYEDEKFLATIVMAYKEEMDRKPPVRITMSLLSKHLPVTLSSYGRVNKYPQTKAFIDKHIESKSEFHIRRFKYAITTILDNGDYPYITHVLAKSGINTEQAHKCKDVVTKMIEEETRRRNKR
jgi:hypothetical protein